MPCRLKVPVASASHTAALRDNEDFDAKNVRLGRPQSPHLTIYRLQLTSMLSLTHRATGMALGGIVTVWGIGKVTSARMITYLYLHFTYELSIVYSKILLIWYLIIWHF
jgi:succinate dehydrogenase/fumarate reductase cytochrome b subunit